MIAPATVHTYDGVRISELEMHILQLDYDIHRLTTIPSHIPAAEIAEKANAIRQSIQQFKSFSKQ